MPNPLVIKPVKEIPEKKHVILAAGRVDNWHVKGFDVLIRAWARVVSCSEFLVSSGGWKLVIAGVWRNPETRTYLDGIAEDCGVKNKIEYTGFVSDMKKIYSESSIFVLSSRYEGFGLVLIEAMSQGCACIACDYKGRQREIISPTPTLPRREGEPSIESQSLGTRNLKLETRNYKFEACETGILCEPDNVEALAEAMKKIIMDDEYRESVRAKAIERSKYYSIENTMDRWEELLASVQRRRS
jgi:glycosyltransferase involved in cell wall biosynthesis